MSHEQIFLGNGEKSLADSYELHRELEKALKLICGVQQPSHTLGMQVGCAFEYYQAMYEIDKIACFIYERLTGNELVAEDTFAKSSAEKKEKNG